MTDYPAAFIPENAWAILCNFALRTVMFEIGDKVSGRDSNLRGVVVKILSTTHVMIEENSFGMHMDVEVCTLVKSETTDFFVPAHFQKDTGTEKKPKKTGPTRIDLHLERIPAALKKKNQPPLEIQLAYFSMALEKALHAKSAPLLVIHGKGQGKLKTALLQLLRKDTRIRSWKELREPLESQSSALELYF